MTDGETLPVLWIVTRDLGLGSQVWMMRQIAGLRGFRPVVLTWADHRSAADLAGSDLTVHVLPFPTNLDAGPLRWRNRLARAGAGNFYASRGAERRYLMNLARPDRPADRPAAILAHFGHAGLRMLPVARALNVPLVCHFHGLDLSSALRNRWYRWSLLRHIGAFDGLVTVGTRQRDWVAAHAPGAGPLHLIPCGVPVAEFSRTPDEEAQPAPAVPVFAVVSRLVPQKGVDWCLRAFARLPRGTARMEVVGEGPERTRLEALAAELGLNLGLGGQVTFRGALPPAGVRGVLAGATAFVQHSLDAPDGWYEGFGVTVAEASAMEVPTIASRCGGLMDQVVDGETGILVDQRDAVGLAGAMARLAGDPALCARLGHAARARALAEFDTVDQVEKLEAALRGAMAARRV